MYSASGRVRELVQTIEPVRRCLNNPEAAEGGIRGESFYQVHVGKINENLFGSNVFHKAFTERGREMQSVASIVTYCPGFKFSLYSAWLSALTHHSTCRFPPSSLLRSLLFVNYTLKLKWTYSKHLVPANMRHASIWPQTLFLCAFLSVSHLHTHTHTHTHTHAFFHFCVSLYLRRGSHSSHLSFISLPFSFSFILLPVFQPPYSFHSAPSSSTMSPILSSTFLC